MIKRENILKNATFGYALHKIVLNTNGKPVDYEFIEINEAFINFTGLKEENIIGKTVKEAIPGIENEKFDWIGFYGKVALENTTENFEQYSEHLGKYYSVHAYSPEKKYFITIFSERTNEIKENLKLKEIINNANVATWEWNIETGETIFNKQWAEIVGYTLEELSPISIETWEKLSHPDDLKKSNEKLNAHFDGKTAQYQCEARMRHKNGHWVWVLDTGKVTLRTDHGKPILMSGIHQDITKRKQIELEAFQKLKLQRLLSELSSDFIITKDIDASIINSFAKLAALNKASRIYYFNIDEEQETMSNTYEWCAEGVSAEKDNLQNLPLSIFPWWMNKLYNKEIIDIPEVSKMPTEANAEREILESQNIKSLMVLPVYGKTQLMGFIGFDNVISSSKWTPNDQNFLELLSGIISNAIIRMLNEKEMFLLKKAVNGNPISIMVTDTSGAITYVNPAFTKITGYKNHEVLGENPRIFKSGNQPESFYVELWETILAGKIWHGELKNKRKNGEIFYASEIIYPIKFITEITHFVCITQDITENKELVKNLIEAKLKAEESDRLKSAFLATMNHELRTPLNHILGFSYMIPDMTDDESIKEFSGLIHESGSNLLNIIEDIFDLSMIEQSEIVIRKDEVFIRDIYLEIKKLSQEVLSESNKDNDLRMKFRIDSSIAIKQIITDKSKVIQVISNIVKNAVKYTNEGVISISFLLTGDNYFMVKVKDSGIGISKEKFNLIFEFFRQGEDSHTREYGGIGIGLAISQKIATAMGGIIKLESELNVGSEFTFSFPVKMYKDRDIESQQEKISYNIPDLSVNKVLIVEDDNIGMGMIVNMLKPTKCKIIKAVNGQEALYAIKDNPDTDIILMDLKMPVMNGFDATRTIRKDFSDLPIIALTAYSMQKDKKKALDSGANDVITKPISKEILIKKMQDYLKK